MEQGTLPFKGFCLALEASPRCRDAEGFQQHQQRARASGTPALSPQGGGAATPPAHPSHGPGPAGNPAGIPKCAENKSGTEPLVWVGSVPTRLRPRPSHGAGPGAVPPPSPGLCPRPGLAAGSARPPAVPVGQGHALEQLREGRVDAEAAAGAAAAAGRPELVGLAGLLVDRVEVVALLGRVLAVRRRDHEVPRVDDLRARGLPPPRPASPPPARRRSAIVRVRRVLVGLRAGGQRPRRPEQPRRPHEHVGGHGPAAAAAEPAPALRRHRPAPPRPGPAALKGDGAAPPPCPRCGHGDTRVPPGWVKNINGEGDAAGLCQKCPRSWFK